MLFNRFTLFFCLSSAFASNSLNSDDDNVSASDFAKLNGEKVGRAKIDNNLEIAYTPGIVNDILVGSLAYTRIIGDGSGEIIIPLVGTQFKDKDMKSPSTGLVDSIAMVGPKYTGIGTGLKYRSFPRHLEEGPFYGGGLRIYHWIWEYQKLQLDSKTLNKGLLEHRKHFQSFIPHMELGYIARLDKTLSFIISAEAGVALHTLDPLELGREKNGTPFNQRTNDKLDPAKFVYYSGNLGLRFAF